jgi:ferredoxin-thioredoxin reductase catalytic chain
MQTYVEKYLEKTGTSRHPDAEVTSDVILGLAANLDETGRPLCPCNYYPDKQAEVARSREWICACEEMKRFKFCHCLLFVAPDGRPITEYLPEGHYARESWGVVPDPTPNKGRESGREAKPGG